MKIPPFVVLALTLVVAAPILFAESHPFGVADLVGMERVSDPQVSPDGLLVTYVLRTTDLDANRGRTDLWLVSLDGSDSRRLTTHEAADWSPRFTPDGKSLLFLSARSGSAQVWRLPLSGGEATQITELPLDAANLVVAPDGKHIAFSLEVFPDCQTLECSVDGQSGREENGSGLLFDQLFVRHWDTTKDGRRSHLFVSPIDDASAPTDITAGLDMDVPSKPFGGAEEITFTPDSSGIVFTARSGGSSESWSTNFDLWLASLDGEDPPRPLTEGNPAWDTEPAFSPNGRLLAWKAQTRPGYESDRFELWVARLESGSLRDARSVTAEWDRSIQGFVFSSDSQRVLATAGDVGKRSLFEIDLESHRVESRFARGYVTAALPAAGGAWVIAHDDLDTPTRLYRLDDTGELEALTQHNQERLAEIDFGAWEQFRFAGWNGDDVHGYVVKPVRFDPAASYPVAFLIHGGPQGSFADHFHYRWNPQTYAGAGYAAVMIDFHGSSGYGQEFTDSIRRDWGGKPLDDLQKGLAAALERYPFLDGDRVCALGASYGGYMINWIAGQWPERFRCLVNHDGVFDMRSMYYSTEELWFPEWDQGGTYFANPAGHERFNPALHVANWQTPMLVIHGALDYRVPETQGLQAFTALQRRGIPSRLLYFPDENHWVLKPRNSLQWHHEVEAWLARWLRAEAD